MSQKIQHNITAYAYGSLLADMAAAATVEVGGLFEGV